MTKYFNTEYFECQCQCSEHIGRVVYQKDDEDSMWDEVYIEFLLNHHLNILQRIKVAFKYIFKLGYSNKVHFDTLVVHEEDIPKIVDILSKFIKKGKGNG